MLQTLYIWTEDKLRLQGMHYEPEKRETCLLFIHGMSGNFIENYFAQVMGEMVQAAGYGFIYAHNRGYNHINDIAVNEVNEQNAYKTRRIGAVYERFLESVFDLEAWMQRVGELGYKKVILIGHSLGCNKAIHYIHTKQPQLLTGLILLSPPDMVAYGKEFGKSEVYERQLAEAKRNLAEGNPRKLLSDMLGGWSTLSSQTFLDLFEDDCPADNLPIMRNPERFPELESVTVPVLGVMGEFDDIFVRSLDYHLDLIAQKATNTPSYSKVFIDGANHVYDNRGAEVAEKVVEWVRGNHNSSF